ncbi:MAG: GrpB family protein [Phycisphaerales bacterium]
MQQRSDAIQCVWGHELGLASGTVRLIEYAPTWPEAFRAMKREVEGVLADRGHVETEHIGSTSVPGMPSKPMIDLMTGLERLDQHEACIEPLESLGYVYKGEFGLPGRHFFVMGEPATAHLHLVEHGSHFWRLNLFFRSILRDDPSARERYLAVKRELADKHADSRPDYTAGKDGIIKSLLREAGWTED